MKILFDSATGFLETTKLCEEDTNELYSDAFYLASDDVKRELSMVFEDFFCIVADFLRWYLFCSV